MRVFNLYGYREDPCPKIPAVGCNCHEARVFVDEREYPIVDGVDASGIEIQKQLEGDPRWPFCCAACGKPFAEIVGNHVDVLTYRVWRAADGREFSDDLGGPPPGAMRHVWWYDTLTPDYGGPDGKTYSVITPDGHDWIMDGPASNGGKWLRTGEPPVVTAEPSIQTPAWHGFLERGWLVEQRAQAPA